MKSKILGLFAFAVFATVILLSGVNAAGSFSASNIEGDDASVMQTNGEFEITFDLTNTAGSDTINWSLSSSGGNAQIKSSTPASVSDGSSSDVVVEAKVVISFDESFSGTLSGTITAASPGNGADAVVPFSVEVLPTPMFCENGAFVNDEDGNSKSLNNIDLEIDITNFGEGDEEEWFALDTIEVEVTLINDFDEDDDMDLNDVTLVLGIFESDDTTFSNNLAEDLIWISDDEEEFDLGDVDAEEEKSHIFEFRVDPEELTEGDYILVVKAYTDEDTDAEEGFCLDFSEDFDEEFYLEFVVEEESDTDKMVVVDVGAFPVPIEAVCGATLEITADVWNIGDEDFEDQIMVNLYSNDFDFNEEQIISGDFDAGDRAEVTFYVDVPVNAGEKATLYFVTYYDYDEDDDEYGEVSEERFPLYLQVSGSSCVSGQAQVSATLESGGKAGKDLVVKATILNSGKDSTSFTLGASGYGDWASSASVDPSTFTLASGESKEVLVTLNTKNTAEGNNLFSLEVMSEGNLVTSQQIQVPISKSLVGSVTGGNPLVSVLVIAIIVIILTIILIFTIKALRR